MGATVNDVLLTVLTGALHRHLVEHGALADEVLVMVPVNLRPADEPLPRNLGNRIGLLPVLLPTGLPTARERLEVLQAQNPAGSAGAAGVLPGDEGFGEAVSSNASGDDGGAEFGRSVADAASDGRSSAGAENADEHRQDDQEADEVENAEVADE